MATFTLMREESYEVPRYSHLWQGWKQRLKDIIVTDIEWDANDEVGIHEVTRTRRFCGWRNLLRPTNKRTRIVPTDLTTQAGVRLESGQIVIGQMAFGPITTPCRIASVQMTDVDGSELATINLTQIRDVIEGDTVHIAPSISVITAL